MPSSPSRPASPTPPPVGRYSFFVEAKEAEQRLDRFLAVRLPGLSRTRIQRLIEKGAVTREAVTIVEPSTRVKSGQNFAIEIAEVKEAPLQPQAMALSILYEDAHLIVIDKPAGLVVHPAPGNPDHTLVNALLAHCGSRFARTSRQERPGIVHRLDKDTSGVMVVAKTEDSLQALKEQFVARRVERSYRALAWGLPRRPQGTIAGNIGRNPRNRKKMAVLPSGGKEAFTRYRTLTAYAEGTISLLECRLLTGRTHQIRVHLTHAGHPLLGDPLYGSGMPRAARRLPQEIRNAIAGLERQALHAQMLGFLHPKSGRSLFFEAPLPADMRNLTNILELI